ncbi:MAG: alpha/beta hydrolase, partial [Eubacteriales bacterium]|nr:alpha/beta hydrolase [Eubacteriales bacterium]
GNTDSYAKTCDDLATQTGRHVYSLEYRLAPEYRFPCALEDCYAVAKELHLTRESVVLMGDSAGGNLAAAVSLLAADRGEFKVNRQILLYPLTYNDHTINSPFPSVTENGTNYLLTSKMICDYMDLYAPDENDRKSPYLAPLLSDNLYGQPETLIVTAEYDPLRDEAEAYGEKLRSFGNLVSVVRINDALHGFFSLPIKFAHVKRCYGVINAFLDGEIVENKSI